MFPAAAVLEQEHGDTPSSTQAQRRCKQQHALTHGGGLHEGKLFLSEAAALDVDTGDLQGQELGWCRQGEVLAAVTLGRVRAGFCCRVEQGLRARGASSRSGHARFSISSRLGN